MDKLLDVTQLSQLLSVRPMTLYGWIHDGTLPHYKIGRLVRFSEVQIQAWLNQKKKEGRTKRVVDVDLT